MTSTDIGLHLDASPIRVVSRLHRFEGRPLAENCITAVINCGGLGDLTFYIPVAQARDFANALTLAAAKVLESESRSGDCALCGTPCNPVVGVHSECIEHKRERDADAADQYAAEMDKAMAEAYRS